MSDKRFGPVAPLPGSIAVLRPVPYDAVRLKPAGWLGEWQQRNQQATLPHVLDHLESGPASANLVRLLADCVQPHQGLMFTDSDIYKTLEAVAWASPDLKPDDPILARGRALVELLNQVQESDGYLNSFVQGADTVARWSDPQWGHEFYCAGHLFQAAVAAARTGELPGLLEIATRFADLLVDTFGEGNPTYVEGHPEVETALVELYRVTGNGEYLALAKRQINDRGHGWLGEDLFGSAYFQDHIPVACGAPATGHAVRQLYLLAGAVDLAVETGDQELLTAVQSTWTDLFASKTYLTGAHGSRHRDEAIGDPYELPADRAYGETCAAIASFQLNWRLLLATGDSRFADEMETALYNAIAGSTSLDGRAFFYSNPLHLRTGHDGGHEDAPSERRAWYKCPCCPPNIARLLASVHDYLITTNDVGVQVQHPTDAVVTTAFGDGTVTLTISTGYPYDGRVEVDVQSSVGYPWELAVRVPGWCQNVSATLDGEPVTFVLSNGAVRVDRNWGNENHRLVVDLNMPVRIVRPHPRIDAVRGCVAIMRGPLVYAIEAADAPEGVVLEDLRLSRVLGERQSEKLASEVVPPFIDLEMTWLDSSSAALYQPSTPKVADEEIVTISAVPYCRWGNRGVGAMRVFIPQAVSDTPAQ